MIERIKHDLSPAQRAVLAGPDAQELARELELPVARVLQLRSAAETFIGQRLAADLAVRALLGRLHQILRLGGNAGLSDAA